MPGILDWPFCPLGSVNPILTEPPNGNIQICEVRKKNYEFEKKFDTVQLPHKSHFDTTESEQNK